MPPATRTKPNDALSSGISHTSISRDWSQSNNIIPDLDASGSAVYNNLGSDSDDHLRVTMQTRVAVRDKTPHRFQVVPLREATNLGPNQTEGFSRLNIPTTPLNILHDSHSGKLGPRSHTWCLSHSHIRSLNQPCDETREVLKPVAPEDSYLDSPQESLAIKPDITPQSADHPGPHSRRALVELDLNRNTRVPTATTKFLSRPMASQSIAMRSLPSRDLLSPFSRTEISVTQTSPRASTGNRPPHGRRPDTQTTLGTHISEISRLFSSENVAPLPSMRRNRSMAGSSIRCETSVGMSETSQETEAKLKRRHAIYRESFCMPYLGKSQGKNIVTFDIGAHRDPAKGVIETRVDEGINFDQLRNPGVGILLPVQALKLSNKHIIRITSANCGEITHPQIVLDLLRDIDEEIAQWTRDDFV